MSVAVNDTVCESCARASQDRPDPDITCLISSRKNRGTSKTQKGYASSNNNKTSIEDIVSFDILADRMIPTEEILKVSSRYLDWFRFYEFFFVKIPLTVP